MIRTFVALVIVAALQGCATAPGQPDPWEGFNRRTFAFNESLDRHVIKPVARGYEKVTPAFARTAVNNFFGNLGDAWTAVNQFLQGKPNDGLADTGRFIINSTFGIFGLIDIATPGGIEKHEEDFGQTLAVWGVEPGPYLVLPLFGPSTARDAPARFADPAWWYYSKPIDSEPLYWTTMTLDAVRTRANLLPADRAIEEAALDKYTFIRDAWLQRRRSQVYDGSPPPKPADADESLR